MILWNSIKGRCKIVSPRTGRPKTNNPKSNDVKVRFDDDLHETLLKYCEKENKTKAEVIREAVVMFLSEK